MPQPGREGGQGKCPQCVSAGLTDSENHSQGVSEASRTEGKLEPRKRKVRHSPPSRQGPQDKLSASCPGCWATPTRVSAEARSLWASEQEPLKQFHHCFVRASWAAATDHSPKDQNGNRCPAERSTPVLEPLSWHQRFHGGELHLGQNQVTPGPGVSRGLCDCQPPLPPGR